MASKKRRRSDKAVWGYAYQILPPQSADRLRAIQILLDREHANAHRESRSITMNTAANLSGRALARAEVTMDSNKIQAPK